MDNEKACEFVENFVDRLEPENGKYRLHGGLLTAKEVEALRVIIGRAAPSDSIQPVPESHEEFTLNEQSLTLECDSDKVLCVDFGTAFSKAAIWEQYDLAPLPLSIGEGLSADPLLVDSVAFVGDDKVFFGPEAILQFERLADSERRLFDSPKEVLTLDFEELLYARPSADQDPSKKFLKKDMLVLFLGYLTALTNRALEKSGENALVRRRFATPGWGDAQERTGSPEFDAIVSQMRRFLAEAQILADTFPIEDWLNGLPVQSATSALRELAKIKDDTLMSAPFVDRPVLEAAASASSVKEKLLNKRPQVVVVDVGAGTTDIGVFKYVGTPDEPKFAAYKNGFSALKIAGKRLDDAFKALVREKIGIYAPSTADASLERHLARNIHDYKRRLFENGSVTVEAEGLPDASITLEDFLGTPTVKNFAAKFEAQISKLLEVADDAGGKSFTSASADNYAVFTGGGAGLPFLRDAFGGGVQVGNQKAYFEIVEPRPDWLGEASEAVRAVFPQISVSVGGASPDLPRELPTVGDTSQAGSRSLPPSYKS